MIRSLEGLITLKELPYTITQFLSREKIHELTEQGIMPHVKFLDPFNPKGTVKYYYKAKELEAFIIKHYIQDCDFEFQCQYKFINFMTAIFGGDESAQIPLELSNIYPIYRIKTNEMIATCGVYFLCKDKKIVYIGQSTNVASRLTAHFEGGEKEFDLCAWIPIQKRDLGNVETALIKHFKPKYNKTIASSEIQPYEMELVKSILYPPTPAIIAEEIEV